MASTYFGLLAEFETAEIPLELMAEKYFGISANKAKNRAARSSLPVPAYRLGSQKSTWLVSAKDLAAHIDNERAKAADTWDKMNG